MAKVIREEVYAALDGEREYQEMRIQRDGSTALHGHHTPEEYLLYMEDYLNEAKHVASRVWGPEAHMQILDIVRKVTALGVACMEQNGVVKRG